MAYRKEVLRLGYRVVRTFFVHTSYAIEPVPHPLHTVPHPLHTVPHPLHTVPHPLHTVPHPLHTATYFSILHMSEVTIRTSMMYQMFPTEHWINSHHQYYYSRANT